MRRCATILVLALVMVFVASPGFAGTTTHGDKRAKIREAGMSLQYPSNWTVVPLTKKALQAQRRVLAKKNPELVKALGDVAAESVSAATKFYAIDLDAQFAGDPASNLNVLVSPNVGFPSSIDVFRSVLGEQYAKLGATIDATSAAKLGDRTTAYRAEVTLPLTQPDGASIVVRQGQLFFRHGADTIIVTVTTSDDAVGVQLIQDVFSSVRPI